MLHDADLGSERTEGRCCKPGVCVEPPSNFKRVLPIQPRQQWNIAGGFCGSLSIQVMMMGHGAWVSEDLIRKANIGAPCHGHSATAEGCELPAFALLMCGQVHLPS